MPTTKRRLTRTEQANYLSCLQELQRGGCDVEIPPTWVNESRGLDIVVAGPPASTVYETPTGSVYYAIGLRMVSNRARVSLLDCEGETEWDDCVGLLPFDQSQSPCWAGNICYPAKQTLNGRIENYLRFHYRGQFIEGVILFSGLARIPEHCRDGGHALFKITFHDQFGHAISAETELFVQRAKRLTQKVLGPRVRSSLYEPQTYVFNNDDRAKAAEPIRPREFSWDDMQSCFAANELSMSSSAQLSVEPAIGTDGARG
jgi:hypothetical protein